MTKSLHDLFHAIVTAPDEETLCQHFLDAVGEYFAAQCWGICLPGAQTGTTQVHVRGELDADEFIERYGKLGRSVDPVMQYVVDHHAPAHEALVASPDHWQQSELYQSCFADYDHRHVMMGPVISQGRLIGGIYLARDSDHLAFSLQDLADLSGLCLHFSAHLTTLRSQQPKESQHSTLKHQLTPRELEIAELVAQGLTNAEIGNQLFITQNSVKQALKRMFRKLNVSARTELVARLKQPTR